MGGGGVLLVVHPGEELLRLALAVHGEDVQDAHGVLAVGGGVGALQVAGDRLDGGGHTRCYGPSLWLLPISGTDFL